MNIKICGLALLVMSTSAIASEFPKLDEAFTWGSGTKNLRPVFDFDDDSCLPGAGISRDGWENGGLNITGSITGGCRASNFIDTANTLHRFACITPINEPGTEYCTHSYALYFEKDQHSDSGIGNAIDTIIGGVIGEKVGIGHRHDWEYVSIWTKNGVETHAGYSAHGEHFIEPWSRVPKLNGRAKFVYHRGYLENHSFRFAKDDETKAENPTGNWVTPTITSWYEMTGDGIANKIMRARLNSFDYGSANIPVIDTHNVYLNKINDTRPAEYPLFTQASLEASNPYPADVWENSIIHVPWGKCLDVWHGVAVGRRLITYECLESSNQQFVYNAADKTIKVKGTNLCVEVYHGINADRQAVQTNLCYSGESNQKWILDGLLIKSALPGTTRCMDRNSENQINLWTCNRSNTNQHFTHDL